MKTAEVNENLIGKRVECLVSGFKRTGIVTGLIDNQWTKGVIVMLDKPLRCADDTFTRWHSTARKTDDFGNLQKTRLI